MAAMLKALIFDFDGLILDTETPDYDAWQEIYAWHGAQLPIELWGQLIGGSGASDFDAAVHLERLLGRPLDRPALTARWRARSDELIERQPIQPGVRECLDDACRLGLRLAIASSSPHNWVDKYLARLGLFDYFEIVKCGDEVPRVKPDPGLYLAALAALRIRAEEAIVFEDSANGVKAAKAAGLFTVAVPLELTRRLGMDGADVVLKSLEGFSLGELAGKFDAAQPPPRSQTRKFPRPAR
jgi:HAD superfamily hydrolase (TIGR01509 family)